MAKIKYAANMGKNHDFELGGNFQGGEFDLTLNSKTSATFVYDLNNFSMVLEGEKFKASGDVLIGGTVTKATFFDDDGDKLATISDVKHSAAEISQMAVGESVSDVLQILCEHDDLLIGSSAGEYMIAEGGDDLINGKGGNDRISGNAGNNDMTGGAGNDTFDFYEDFGKDVIRDFDIGLEGSFDTIYIRGVEFTLVKSADNFLKIVFENGSSVLLEGIRYSERNDVHFDLGV